VTGRGRRRTARRTAITFDTAGLLAVDGGSQRVHALLDRLAGTGLRFAVPARALARAWRGTPDQALLRRLLDSDQVEIVPMDDAVARASGALCRISGTDDVIDASVVLCARERGHKAVVTTNGDSLRRLDPTLTMFAP